MVAEPFALSLRPGGFLSPHPGAGREEVGDLLAPDRPLERQPGSPDRNTRTGTEGVPYGHTALD
jgi:hypothetical protein